MFRTGKSRAAVITALIIAAVFVMRPLTPDNMIRYVTHAQADSFFGGSLLALLTNDRSRQPNDIQLAAPVKRTEGISLIILFFLSVYLFDNFLNIPEVKYTVYTALSLLILYLACRNDGWFALRDGGAASRIMGFLGQVSGSTYVSHVLLYSCVYWNINNLGLIPQTLNNGPAGVAVQVIFLLIAAPLVGHLSYQFIEKPYGAFGKKLMNEIDIN